MNLGVAPPALMHAIRFLLLAPKGLFFRDQNISRAEHVAFASYFGELEDHPVERVATRIIPASCGSTSRPITPKHRYENAALRRTLAREADIDYPSCHRKMLRAGITGDTSY